MFRNWCLWVCILARISELESKRELPSFLKPCHRNNQLNECIKTTMLELKPELAKGIPEMKIPSLHPLFVPKMNTSHDNIELVFINYNIEPLEDYTIKNVQMDLEKCELFIDLLYPKLVSYGDYRVKGKLLLFQLDGQGHISLNFTDSTLKTTVKCNKITKNGKEYADFTSIESTVTIADFRLDLTDLFRDNPELTKSTVVVFNENSKELIKEFEHVVGVAVGEGITLQIIQSVFKLFPLDVILPQ